MTSLSRRGILGSIICAPAIVRASSLMAVKVWHDDLNEANLLQAFVEIRDRYIITSSSAWMISWSDPDTGITEFWPKNVRAA